MTAWIQLFLDTPTDTADDALAFWAAATGWPPSAPRGEHDQFRTLVPPAGSSYVKVQAVGDGGPRVHLDLDTPDPGAAVRVSRDLGATDAWQYDGVPVMRSPGGLLLCHTRLEESPHLVRDGSTILDQVCIDVPGRHWDREVAFWQGVTGREPEEATRPEFLRLPPVDGVRILLQRLGDHDGVVHAHPDFASADRPADTERHVGLGATVEGTFEFWTVLTAPGGQVYCLTDRDPCG